ncbi:hypothetical protein [Lysobacter enzymogenes]|uniref:hypothetical protein n=1 Tax=Lysobacter enzymogenes TaxID=69 RepID=UPI0019D28350|nr:hypothetical protein [Lysobacter enzymogenes]
MREKWPLQCRYPHRPHAIAEGSSIHPCPREMNFRGFNLARQRHRMLSTGALIRDSILARAAPNSARKLFRVALKGSSLAVGANGPGRNPTQVARKKISPSLAPTWFNADVECVARKSSSVVHKPLQLTHEARRFVEKGQARYRRGISA